ncbi:glycosyltransferase [candidate division WOR-3 bacterium]|nr:glycosyltransferase [candidate division WOR-3 bacterium]
MNLMSEKLTQAIKNPKRVFYRFKEKLTKKTCEESLIDESIRYFPSKEEGIKIFFVESKYDYGDKNRGLSFEENNFLHTLVHSCYETIVFDPILTMKKYGKKTMNRILIESVYRWNPDIVFFVLFKDEIELDTLIEIRDSMGIKTLNWFCDDHWRFDNFSKIYASFLSYVITTYKPTVEKYKLIGVKNVILSQWACNHYLYKRLKLPYLYDVSFVGQPHGDRYKIIRRIRKAGIKVETFGYGWPNGRVTTYEMIKIFNQTKINLNLSNASRGKINQIKGRDFEIPGCGGLMITGYNENLKDYYRIGKEMVCYNTVDDLIELLRHYLKNDEERETIREAGYKRVSAEHTYEERFQKIFKKTLEDRNL